MKHTHLTTKESRLLFFAENVSSKPERRPKKNPTLASVKRATENDRKSLKENLINGQTDAMKILEQENEELQKELRTAKTEHATILKNAPDNEAHTYDKLKGNLSRSEKVIRMYKDDAEAYDKYFRRISLAKSYDREGEDKSRKAALKTLGKHFSNTARVKGFQGLSMKNPQWGVSTQRPDLVQNSIATEEKSRDGFLTEIRALSIYSAIAPKETTIKNKRDAIRKNENKIREMKKGIKKQKAETARRGLTGKELEAFDNKLRLDQAKEDKLGKGWKELSAHGKANFRYSMADGKLIARHLKSWAHYRLEPDNNYQWRKVRINSAGKWIDVL